MKKLPPNLFFRLNRAANLLEIEVDDLLLMGVSGSIFLSTIIHQYEGVLYQAGNLPPDHGSKDIENLLFGSIISTREDTERYLNEGVFDGMKCLASGLWHVPSDFIASLAGVKRAPDIPLIFSPAYIKKELDITSGRYFFYDFREHDTTVSSMEDLYISRPWVEYIAESMDKNQPIPSILHLGSHDLYEKEFKNIEHGNRARHSLNRENSIMALIYVKRHYPEECKGKNGKETNEAWANATIDHWPHVGGDYDEPSTDYLKKIISDMDRLPEKRTTAGKKKS
ncbi:hypothetical protein PR344_001711 [Escherichia coli]|nr:hypothetical protein [Escherichia coli]